MCYIPKYFVKKEQQAKLLCVIVNSLKYGAIKADVRYKATAKEVLKEKKG